MSKSNPYNRLLGYLLWIDREGAKEPELVYVPRNTKLKLPSGKEYKVTLRNIRLYLIDLRKIDPTIIAVQVDKLSRVGKFKWPKDKEKK